MSGRYSKENFEYKENGGVYLDKEGCKKFIAEFEKRLKINCLKKYLYFTENNDDITIDTELLKRLGKDKSDDIDLFTNIKVGIGTWHSM